MTLISRYTIIENKLHIQTPYSDQVVKICRGWAGKYTGGAWVLPMTRLEEVQKEMGRDLEDLVEVEVTKEHYKDSGAQIRLGWYILAGRRGRDSRADVYADLVKGTIPSFGGSMKHPSVSESDDAAFRLWVPRDFAVARNLPIVTDPKESVAMPYMLRKSEGELSLCKAGKQIANFTDPADEDIANTICNILNESPNK